jgi:hypothetical protein
MSQRVNPYLFEQLKGNFTDQQLKNYEQTGEALHSIPFETIDTSYQELEQAAYARMALESGLHPSYLTAEERSVIEKIYGDEFIKNTILKNAMSSE